MNLHFTRWDLILLVCVTGMGMIVAYIRDPRWKVLMVALPIPSTLAMLSLHRPVDATNVLGFVLLLGYTHGVRILFNRLHIPIIPAIVLCAVGYCACASSLVHVVPITSAAFWWTCLLGIIVSVVLAVKSSYRKEPSHRSPMSIWLKLPVMAGVIFTLIVMKKHLLGFMTMFPMVGVISSYEARHSLWAVCRQVQAFVIAFVPLLIVSHLLQPALGIERSLIAALIVYGIVLSLVTKWMWKKESDEQT